MAIETEAPPTPATPAVQEPIAVPAPISRVPLQPLDEVALILPPSPPLLDLTVEPDNLWQRIRNGFGMPDLHGPLVADEQAFYLNRPELIRRIIERSGRYLFYIVDELERRNMPTELALLPMIESAFNPLAASKARALGMWQFIPSTGKNFNLDQNWWRDERRDIVASTNAALTYLQRIYEMHGDWHLALASYNWGEGAVARAIARNEAKRLPTDYESLSMPNETRHYVPRLQALKNIIAQPELFGLSLAPLANRPYFGSVDLPGDMDVAIAAKLAEVPLDEFIALNPAYHRPMMRGDQATQIILPTDKVDVFRGNLARYTAQDKPLTHWRTYQLKKGEKLETVAARHGLTLAGLKQLNGLTPKVKIKPGLNLLVPGPGAQVSTQLAALLPKMPSESKSRGQHHTKKKGGHQGSKKSVAKPRSSHGRKSR